MSRKLFCFGARTVLDTNLGSLRRSCVRDRQRSQTQSQVTSVSGLAQMLPAVIVRIQGSDVDASVTRMVEGTISVGPTSNGPPGIGAGISMWDVAL